MEQDINRQVRLKSRPADIPEAENFEIVEAPVPELGDNEVLVRNIYLSVEPAMRGWVSAVANYSEPVKPWWYRLQRVRSARASVKLAR